MESFNKSDIRSILLSGFSEIPTFLFKLLICLIEFIKSSDEISMETKKAKSRFIGIKLYDIKFLLLLSNYNII